MRRQTLRRAHDRIDLARLVEASRLVFRGVHRGSFASATVRYRHDLIGATRSGCGSCQPRTVARTDDTAGASANYASWRDSISTARAAADRTRGTGSSRATVTAAKSSPT